jgi:hypothetical protein
MATSPHARTKALFSPFAMACSPGRSCQVDRFDPVVPGANAGIGHPVVFICAPFVPSGQVRDFGHGTLAVVLH